MRYTDTHIDDILHDLSPKISLEELEASLAKNTAERAENSEQKKKKRPIVKSAEANAAAAAAVKAKAEGLAARFKTKKLRKENAIAAKAGAADTPNPEKYKKFIQIVIHETGKSNPTLQEIRKKMVDLGENEMVTQNILHEFGDDDKPVDVDKFIQFYVQNKMENDIPIFANRLFTESGNSHTIESIIRHMTMNGQSKSVIDQIRTVFPAKKVVTFEEFRNAFEKAITERVARQDQENKIKAITKIQALGRGFVARSRSRSSSRGRLSPDSISSSATASPRSEVSNSPTNSGSSTARSSHTDSDLQSPDISRTKSTNKRGWFEKGWFGSSKASADASPATTTKKRWFGSSKDSADASPATTDKKEGFFSRRRKRKDASPATTDKKEGFFSRRRKRTYESITPSGSEDDTKKTSSKNNTTGRTGRNSNSSIKSRNDSEESEDEDDSVRDPPTRNNNDRPARVKTVKSRRRIDSEESEDEDDIEPGRPSRIKDERSTRLQNDKTRRTGMSGDQDDHRNEKWKQYWTEEEGTYYVKGSHVLYTPLPEWKEGVHWVVGNKRDQVKNVGQYTEGQPNNSVYQGPDDGPDENEQNETRGGEDDDEEIPSKSTRKPKPPEVWNLQMPTYSERDIPDKLPVPREALELIDDKGKRMSLVYIIWSVILCILCFVGMVGWRNVENDSPMFRKNKLSCSQGPCPLNKTHQSVHAFASDYMGMSQSISFQSPFMQTHVMNTEGISKMIPTWMSNGTTTYDVIDLCVLNERRMIPTSRSVPTWISNGMNGTNGTNGMNEITEYKLRVEAPDNKSMITCTQTETFCPIVTTGQAETCENWLDRIENHTSSDTWPSNVSAAGKVSLCNQYAATYASQPYRAQIICKMMRSPRMSLAHVQNNNYNLFSTHNETYLAGCLNVILAVFFCAIALSVLRQLLLGSNNLDYFAYSDVEKETRLRTVDGLFSLLMIGQAFIVVTVYFGLLAKTATENHQYVKSMLLPTGSIIITAMSGAVTVLLVACSPFYRMGSVAADKAVQFDEEDPEPPQKYTTLSMNRYHRFLLTRNDLCLAYCNFVTFPILVLLVYVRYEWYSIDVHIQRAFFSAVAVGALNIVEVSVMGVMYLVTEMDSYRTRTMYGHVSLFAHSNLINFTVQFVFMMSKMAIFIPTILEIKQNIRWTYSKDASNQFYGQRNGNQPLVIVMISSFAVNHMFYIVWNVISNLGFDNKIRKLIPQSIDPNLIVFLLMNTLVIYVINYAEQ
jgi:hypothetical protein